MGKAKAIKKSFGTCFASIVRLRKYHAKYRYPIYHGCEYDRVLEVPFFIAFGPAFFFFITMNSSKPESHWVHQGYGFPKTKINDKQVQY